MDKIEYLEILFNNCDNLIYVSKGSIDLLLENNIDVDNTIDFCNDSKIKILYTNENLIFSSDMDVEEFQNKDKEIIKEFLNIMYNDFDNDIYNYNIFEDFIIKKCTKKTEYYYYDKYNEKIRKKTLDYDMDCIGRTMINFDYLENYAIFNIETSEDNIYNSIMYDIFKESPPAT